MRSWLPPWTDAATFYHELLMSNEDRFKPIFDYLARRGVGKETIRTFNIGYAPPYSDEQQYNGRALLDGFLPHVEKDADAFDAFSNGGLFRFLNDATVKGYGYYCRQIDFNRKNLFSRNYGDYFAGRMVFPIYDADARPTGLVGRRPGDRGVRWLKHQTREVPLSARCRLYGIDKARHFIRHYRTIILVEGIFDYFAFTNLLQIRTKRSWSPHWVHTSPPRRRPFSRDTTSSTILSPTTGMNSAETASNGLQPKQAAGSITLAVRQTVRTLTIC
jgi:DNA primase